MLIHFVLKTPLLGLVSSVVVLLVASGNTLFSEVLSGSKFCVTSGNSASGQVFVASGSGKSGVGNGLFGWLDAPVSFVFFFGASFASGNADKALRLLALLSSISLCMAIRVGVG